MDSFAIFTWTLTACTIAGTYLNSKQNKYGFLIWGLCNMLWLGVDFTRGIYAQAALYVVFIGFNMYGWKQWGKFIKIPMSFHEKFIPGQYGHVDIIDDLEKIKMRLFGHINLYWNGKKYDDVVSVEFNRQELELVFDSVKYCANVCKYAIK